MPIKPITIDTIKYLAHSLAQKTMKWNEPIPEFDSRYPNVLESCLATPFQRFQNKTFYKGLVQKGAVLFYLLIKNHPFQNGNKRIAVTALLVFLFLNNKWLQVDTKELYNFSVWVAQSPPKLKNEVVKSIERFITLNIIPFDIEAALAKK